MNIHDQDTFRRGKKEGAEQKAIETAKKLLSFGDSIEKIMQVTGLTKEEIEQLLQEI
ncbi:MAG: hypothetical protein J6J67_00010 [Treponema sp.]|nr:hypothetical protein [Treponema sp.]